MIALIVIFSPLIFVVGILGVTFLGLIRPSTYLLVWLLWLPRGKDVLFVSSDSPVWQAYMREQVLPLVEKRAVILNWSDRNRWPRWSFAAHLFRLFGGSKEFNPLVVIFRPLKRAHTFRFFRAFKELKRGNALPLDQLRGELIADL